MGDGISRHTPTLAGSIQSRVVSCDPALFPHIGDLLTGLTNDWTWLEVGDTVEDVTLAAWAAVTSFYGDAMIGQIDLFLKALPSGWLELDGTTYDEADYPELYAAIHADFKNETLEQFTLPDFSDRFVVAEGSSYGIGDTGGSDTHTLTESEMPAHTHTYTPPLADVDLEAPGAPDILAARLGTPTTTSSTGGGNAHENRPPYIAVTFGIFAGR